MNMLWTQLFFVALTLSTINCQTLEDLIKKVTSKKTHLNNKDQSTKLSRLNLLYHQKDKILLKSMAPNVSTAKLASLVLVHLEYIWPIH